MAGIHGEIRRMAIDIDKYIGRSFSDDLKYSLSSREEDFWDAVYRKAFPNLRHWELVHDLDKQKQGIDRALYLNNGNVLWIDEKKRSKDYGDILLEHTSNVERGTVGWMEKDLTIDYLAYAIMPTKTCYLFPWPMLRLAWLEHKDQWRREYKDDYPGRTNLGHGRFYTTHSVAIPTHVLQRAVTNVSVIHVAGDV